MPQFASVVPSLLNQSRSVASCLSMSRFIVVCLFYSISICLNPPRVLRVCVCHISLRQSVPACLGQSQFVTVCISLNHSASVCFSISRSVSDRLSLVSQNYSLPFSHCATVFRSLSQSVPVCVTPPLCLSACLLLFLFHSVSDCVNLFWSMSVYFSLSDF